MIVHRLVKYPEPEDFKYYLEASPAIPIDSQEYPHLAVLAAILFDAGKHPLTPFAEPPPPPPVHVPVPVYSFLQERPWIEPLKVLVTMWTYLESKSYSSEPSSVFDWGSRTVSFYYNLWHFYFLISIVEATVHFDCEDDNDRNVWIADVVATPSSTHDSIPSLDSDFWDRVSSVPRTKLERVGVRPNPKLVGPNSPDPQLLITSPSTMKLTTYIGRGGTCDAFRGTWLGLPIVAKDGDRSNNARRFSREVHAYLRLGHLCGSVVPEFFGLYRTDSFALLVLEDAGDMTYRHVPHVSRTYRDTGNRPDHWAVLDVQERWHF
jgi:hypothetical protein